MVSFMQNPGQSEKQDSEEVTTPHNMYREKIFLLAERNVLSCIFRSHVQAPFTFKKTPPT